MDLNDCWTFCGSLFSLLISRIFNKNWKKKFNFFKKNFTDQSLIKLGDSNEEKVENEQSKNNSISSNSESQTSNKTTESNQQQDDQSSFTNSRW